MPQRLVWSEGAVNQNRTIKIAVLRALQEMEGPAGAARISRRLQNEGVDLQPRTIRFYLLQLDRDGLTRFISRRIGRELTPRGQDELAHSNIIDKVGFVASKIDSLGYRMTFRNDSGAGTIITNIATIPKPFLSRAFEYMKPVFARQLGMGSKIAIAREDETIAGFKVPRDTVAIGTVCSVTVNGIMLSERIPVTSRFGGLLEMNDGKPVRFLELIEYRGTTIDPLEFFISANMTRVRDCARTGTGIIGASFREIPAVAVDEVQRVSRQMERHGLGGILVVGKPNQPLLDIPVSEGRCGIVVVGGLNPVAAMREGGSEVSIRSLAGLEEFSSFQSFHTLRDRFSS